MKNSVTEHSERENTAALCGAINRESVRSLRTYGLQAEGKIDRMWLRQVRSARYEGFVYQGGVTLGQVRLPFASTEDECPADGTPVVVWWDRGFTCAHRDEIHGAGRLSGRSNELAA
jgi:hypothetical protein